MAQRLLDGIDYLNSSAYALPNTDLSFKIHYWGGTAVHYDNPVHKHSFYEACYIVQGKGTYFDHHQEFTLDQHVLFLSRPGLLHQIRSDTGLYIVYVAFEVLEEQSSEYAARQFAQLHHTDRIVLSDAADHPTALLWRSLLTQAAGQNDFKHVIVAQLAHSLLLSFYDAFSDPSKEHRSVIPHASTSTLLYQARLFIRDNLSTPLRLSDVASYLHISERHLSRLFSHELNETFTDYIRKRRVELATYLLKTTDFPLHIIAEQIGFSSVHYFARVFKAIVGRTPGQYRQLAEGEHPSTH